ncbi:hypothetical protein MHYP_G00225020 [Metynnis hypsauchen]
MLSMVQRSRRLPGDGFLLPKTRIFKLRSELTLTDRVERRLDCKAQNLLLKDVSHWKSSEAEQLSFQRNILSLGLIQYGGSPYECELCDTLEFMHRGLFSQLSEGWSSPALFLCYKMMKEGLKDTGALTERFRQRMHFPHISDKED